MRVTLVEDDSQLLESLRVLLSGEPGVEVAGAYLSAEDAVRARPWPNTDILLADIDLPGMSGVDLIGRVKARHPDINCMAYTIYEDRATVFAAIKAGACGYILKGSTPRELIEALRELNAGGAPMSPKVARKVILEFQQPATDQPTANAGPGLTQREQDVLRLIEKGCSYKEIAAALAMSAHTVHSHIKHIYEKVQARGRAEVLRKARQRGWL